MVSRAAPTPAAAFLLTLLVACSSVASDRDASGTATRQRNEAEAAAPLVGADSPADLGRRAARPPVAVSPPAAPPVPVPTAAAAPLEPFAMNLFEVGDFVPQHTFEWCVAASIQMA